MDIDHRAIKRRKMKPIFASNSLSKSQTKKTWYSLCLVTCCKFALAFYL